MRLKTILMSAAVLAAGVWLLPISAAQAISLTFTGTQGSLGELVTYHFTGPSTLTMTLTATSTADVLVPANVLAAVFFDTDEFPSATLTRAGEVVNTGSTVFLLPTAPGQDIGGERTYGAGLAGAPGNTVLGVGSTGLGLFGPADLFPDNNLQYPVSQDGPQYGITGADDNPVTGYGTSLDQPNYTGQNEQLPVPEPLTAVGLVMGLGGMAAYIRKRRITT